MKDGGVRPRCCIKIDRSKSNIKTWPEIDVMKNAKLCHTIDKRAGMLLNEIIADVWACGVLKKSLGIWLICGLYSTCISLAYVVRPVWPSNGHLNWWMWISWENVERIVVQSECIITTTSTYHARRSINININIWNVSPIVIGIGKLWCNNNNSQSESSESCVSEGN